MKNVKNRFRNITTTTLTLLALVLLSQVAVGQATVFGNSPAAGAFLGWDDINNTFLNVRQDDLLRMRFRGVPYAPVGGVPSGPIGTTNYTSASRVMLDVQGDNTWNAITPYSMLHLHGSLAAPNMRREWMHVGTSYTDEGDVFYVGLQQQPDNLYNPGGDKIVDAALAWGCNYSNEATGPDNMRFIFIQPMNSSGNPENSQSGLEVARFTPEGEFGIGNFYTNGLNEQPTQRLDVDGTARLRQMPNNSPNVVITGVEADATGDYVLNYATFEEIGDELDIDIPCDWDVVNGGDDLAMGYGGACVTEQMLVGTSLQTGSTAKAFMTKDYVGRTLMVQATVGNPLLNETAGHFTARNGSQNFGIDAEANTGVIASTGIRGQASRSPLNIGVFGGASNASDFNYGVSGLANGGSGASSPLNNVGVLGRAIGQSERVNFGGYFFSCDGPINIGVYAENCDSENQDSWAAYFVGQSVTTMVPITLSDESIKSDVESIDGALEIIYQLQPKKYNYQHEIFPHLGLSNKPSYGFLAQEIQEVIPAIVQQVNHPAKYDSTGVQISPEESLLGIRYDEIIPILTAGIKEQQTQITEQAQTIDELQQSLNNQNDLIAQMTDQMDALANQVNDCCDGGIKYNAPDQGHGNLNENFKSGGNVLDQNTPNPFRSQTTISYSLETGGKVLLNVYDKAGKILSTLEESEQPAGTYRYEWNASGLPAGLYHYALYVDGELLVKKAIKLAD